MNKLTVDYIEFIKAVNKKLEARIKAELLVKVINELSDKLGHPKDDLKYLIKEMIKKG